MQIKRENEVDEDTLIHEPVLLNEVIKYLKINELAHLKSQAKVIDATFGYAGHGVEFLMRGIDVLGIETDRQMIEFAKKRLSKDLKSPEHFPATKVKTKNSQKLKDKISRLSRRIGKYLISQGNFRDMKKIAVENNFTECDAILFDLGVSSYQLTSGNRGFSFNNPEAVLDMRTDTGSDQPLAKDFLNLMSKEELMKTFMISCGYKFAKELTQSVIKKRKINSFVKVGDFLNLITTIHPPKNERLHPATLPFLALRIKVNNELENLKDALSQVHDLLKIGGRLAVISFHSGEDRIVKEFIRGSVKRGLFMKITTKPICPSEQEMIINRRSRSAKLRVIERI